MTSTAPNRRNGVYPDSDGQPIADNTKQFRWIAIIKENLELLFADRPDVFVAGDLLWYPVQGDNTSAKHPKQVYRQLFRVFHCRSYQRKLSQ